MDRYLEMLEFMRPARNPYELAFINRYLAHYGMNVDTFGNHWMDIGDNPTILWSSHTDTVHNQGGLQIIERTKNGLARLAPKQKRSTCLGADCTTGVWIMLEMIDAGVPGRYVFHRDEEIGGHGSQFIVQKTPEVLKGIQAAIAFDRKGDNEVITHQGSKTASNEFAASLAAILGNGYKPSSNGMFTDTKNYRRVVPECTNIGVGYAHAHTRSETQDLGHLKWLRDRMVQFDGSKLVIARDPSEPDPIYYGYGYGNGKRPTLTDRIRQNPWVAAEMLRSYGVNLETFEDECAYYQSGWTRFA